MFQWIGDNAGTIIVSVLLAALVAGIVIRLRRDKKQGKSSCGCNCGSCPMAGACHRELTPEAKTILAADKKTPA